MYKQNVDSFNYPARRGLVLASIGVFRTKFIDFSTLTPQTNVHAAHCLINYVSRLVMSLLFVHLTWRSSRFSSKTLFLTGKSRQARLSVCCRRLIAGPDCSKALDSKASNPFFLERLEFGVRWLEVQWKCLCLSGGRRSGCYYLFI